MSLTTVERYELVISEIKREIARRISFFKGMETADPGCTVYVRDVKAQEELMWNWLNEEIEKIEKLKT